MWRILVVKPEDPFLHSPKINKELKMALFLTSQQPSLLLRNPKTSRLSYYSHHHQSLSKLSLHFSTNPRFSSVRIHSSLSDGENEQLNPINKSSSGGGGGDITDEWGEKSGPEPDSSYTKLPDTDPPTNEDEWGGGGGGIENSENYKDYNSVPDNGTAAAAPVVDDTDTLGDLKRCLVDTFYDTDLGFKASTEVRADVLELVNQLEALNPTPAPTEATSLLNGNWVLLYTAASELLPLLAAGTLPLLKVKSICQSINTSTLTIDNSTTLSSPFASFSFSASATFEVRSPSRIQVQFKEGSFKAPEISSSISLPGSIDIFGQKVDLSPVQNSLNPLQEVVANISRVISGQPPLKVPIPGERTSSWLLTTYLDEDFRISRGDGGLFILAKEGSPLLDQ